MLDKIEIVTDGGKEFCNKVSQDLYDKLRVTHNHTSPAHPQCNSQAEVANKHFQKYLARMCEGDTLHWEHLSDNNLRLQAMQRARDGAHEHATSQLLSYKHQQDKNLLAPC